MKFHIVSKGQMKETCTKGNDEPFDVIQRSGCWAKSNTYVWCPSETFSLNNIFLNFEFYKK